MNLLAMTRRRFLKAANAAISLAIIGVHVTGKSYAGVKDYVGARIRATYGHDRVMQYRKSQDNPFVKKLFGEFLPEPGCEKSHQLLHSSYTDRSANVKRIKDVRSRLK